MSAAARRSLLVCAVVWCLVAPTAAAAPADAGDGTAIVYAGDELTLASAPDRHVHGETTLPPGAEVLVRVRSVENAPVSFVRADTAVVSAFGTFEAAVDLAAVTPGTTVQVTVSRDGERLAAARGRVVECGIGCRPNGTDARAGVPELRRVPVDGVVRVPVGTDGTGGSTLVVERFDGPDLTVPIPNASGNGTVVEIDTATGELLARRFVPPTADRPGGRLAVGTHVVALYDGRPNGTPTDVGVIVVYRPFSLESSTEAGADADSPLPPLGPGRPAPTSAADGASAPLRPAQAIGLGALFAAVGIVVLVDALDRYQSRRR